MKINMTRWTVQAAVSTLTLMMFLGSPSSLLGQDDPQESSKELRQLRAQLRQNSDLLAVKQAEANQLKSRLNAVEAEASALNQNRFIQSPAFPSAGLNNPANPFGQPAQVRGLAAPTTQWATGQPGNLHALAAINGQGNWRNVFMNKQNESQQKINEILQAIGKADEDSDKEEMKAELKALLEAQYDAYLESLESPLQKMEERLDKLRAEYEKRKTARDELVKLRLDGFWYKANGMSWPGESSNGLFRVRSNFSAGQPLAVPRPAQAPSYYLPAPSSSPKLPKALNKKK